MIDIFAECAGEPSTGPSQNTTQVVIFSYAAFSSTCYLAGNTASSESIAAYNVFPGTLAFTRKSLFCRIFASIVGVATV